MVKINLEKQFEFYLKKVFGDREISGIQLQETKRAFYAGASQLRKAFLEISELPEGETMPIFDDIESQISKFWLTEAEIIK